MSNILKVVGFDPSLSNWGVVRANLDLSDQEFIVTSMNLIVTEPEKDKKLKKQVRKNSEDIDRCQLLYAGMVRACEGALIAFVEVPVGSQSARAMASYGMCCGILAACPIPIIQVTPNEVKLAGAGVKTATKEEMIAWATHAHPEAHWLLHRQNGKGFKKGDLTNSNEHLADACAAIKAGVDSDEFQRMLAMMQRPVFTGLAAVS